MTEDPAAIIVGAGIAGLTIALAMAQHGLSVRLYERAPELTEVGAGLQLSPNATRLLGRLGVIDVLGERAVRPQAVALINARNLSPLASVPLGDAGEARWNAPYLVTHRADLQSALLERARSEALIEVVTGAFVEKTEFSKNGGARLHIRRDETVEDICTPLLISADGVWSHSRRLVRSSVRSRFTGYVAWRATLPVTAAKTALGDALAADRVTAFLDPAFHLVAYPISKGRAINLVAILPGEVPLDAWAQDADDTPLKKVLARANPSLGRLAEAEGARWTVWPVHEVNPADAWTSPRGLALIGDAAHAVPPFAAQGAAMAIEDAVLLARLLARTPDNPVHALAAYEAARKPRVVRVARRGAFNRFVWHARGPIALARDMVLRGRSDEALMADFDWLYGFDAEAPEHF
ncbi:FAD-dependent monooxygenase [Nitratireductor kimnyeongensis]|uniref:FAD-dependent monooxygenase n=1 Tax=Nitratireductor kimnyeongensis TaxID=430679 RepID=A0ABW0T4P5_9HYPH|nr:FAD-dependent monooxygenase [Nitratireductor kimnyeongensis]QZZ35179.1 FAD-dependent monooxygenase [Nitratireductor kimnyeongensis]